MSENKTVLKAIETGVPGRVLLADETLGGVMREYVEVARFAKDGEILRVISEEYGHGFEILEVVRAEGDENEYAGIIARSVVSNRQSWGLVHTEYVVLEPTDYVRIDDRRYLLEAPDRVANIGNKILAVEGESKYIHIGEIGKVLVSYDDSVKADWNDNPRVYKNGRWWINHDKYRILTPAPASPYDIAALHPRVLPYYRRHVRGNANTSAELALLKLKRNAILAHEAGFSRTDERGRMYCRYGHLSILVVGNEIVWIRQEAKVPKGWRVNLDRYRELNATLGITAMELEIHVTCTQNANSDENFPPHIVKALEDATEAAYADGVKAGEAKALAQIDEVRRTAYWDGYDNGREDERALMEAQKTGVMARPRQKTRAEVVEMAKRFLHYAKERGSRDGRTWNYLKCVMWDDIGVNARYHINREARVVVCVLHDFGDNAVVARGIAKCEPNDVFNVHIGKAIALARALGIEVPADFLNAPQPEKAEVGDVVMAEFEDGFRPVSVVPDAINIVFGQTVAETSEFARMSKIIDDTRDGYVYDVEKYRQATAKAGRAAQAKRAKSRTQSRGKGRVAA